MGGGPDKEHMVIALWSPEPVEIIKEIKARFPYIDITYLHLSHPSPGGSPVDSIPAEIYKSATIWVTLGVLPPTPDVVPHLKLIHVFSAGVDHYANHPILSDSEIPITTSSGISAPPIAEWVLMATLSLSKHFAATYEWQKDHHWGKSEAGLKPRRDWVGKKVGIAGYGSIGRQVGRCFSALGCQVVAYTASPRRTTESRRDNGYIVPGTGDREGTVPSAWYSGTSREELHGFLRTGLDLLVVCLPLTSATEKLFGKDEFQILSDACTTSGGCYLANIARGRIIDQPALVEALNGGVLGGAVLDVTDPEPLPSDDPLWEARNVVVSPHVSANGVEYEERAYAVLVENLARLGAGERLVNEVRRGRGY